MIKKELSKHVLAAAHSGTLVTPKHDPASGSVLWPNFRTVLTPGTSASLCQMFESQSYEAEEYNDPRYTSPSYSVRAHDPSVTPGALGLPPNSPLPVTCQHRVKLHTFWSGVTPATWTARGCKVRVA
jgi:hypothetical protein